MNVNIVYTGLNKGNVLDRQARALADAGGWTCSRNPNGAADLNYFICYVEYAEQYSDWHKTPVGAWFTHREGHLPYKAFWWDLAVNNVDLRVTAARQYLDILQPFGTTALARPAIDPQFKIQPRHKRQYPQVGVAGWVHPGGRKGEKLVAKLAASPLAQKVKLMATGSGWPIDTVELGWEQMADWYTQLDVYLCTSSIEGVPMPPLEALACGTPVVIPAGVGMLDDLPDIPGIYRYPAGQYEAMQTALETALETPYDRGALRAAVAPYNAQNWAADHKTAFLSMDTQRKIESDRHGNRGVLYVAYGEPSRNCAKAAIASFRAHMPGIEVAVASTTPLGVEDQFIEYPDIDIGGRHAKTKIYEIAPRDWEYVLYLDADTEVVADISFLYGVLQDGWDMVICKNPDKYHVAWEMKRSDNHDECDYTFAQLGTGELIQLNGGVFGFARNERTRAFFDAWHTEWQRWGKRDQGALLRALWQCPLRLYVLENYPWNCITRYDRREDVCIKHRPMTARRWRGKVIERSDSPAAWAAVKEWERGQGK